MSAPASPQRSYGHDRKTQARPTPLPVRPFVELPGTATILTLSRHMCKWPIGHPDAEDFTFCGRRASDEGPYCLDHARVAYQPPQGKKKSSGAELIRGLRRYA